MQGRKKKKKKKKLPFGLRMKEAEVGSGGIANGNLGNGLHS